MKEYATRAESFWREAEQHVFLALGSLAAAIVVGLPLGILCHRIAALKGMTLQVLNIVQTIPSIALFGILMAPLGYFAATVPLAFAIGIRGIGAAPALVALFLYSLLPVVANTVVGLDQVPRDVVDARTRHGPVAPAAALAGQVAARPPGHPHRHSHRAGAESSALPPSRR